MLLLSSDHTLSQQPAITVHENPSSQPDEDLSKDDVRERIRALTMQKIREAESALETIREQCPLLRSKTHNVQPSSCRTKPLTIGSCSCLEDVYKLYLSRRNNIFSSYGKGTAQEVIKMLLKTLTPEIHKQTLAKLSRISCPVRGPFERISILCSFSRQTRDMDDEFRAIVTEHLESLLRKTLEKRTYFCPSQLDFDGEAWIWWAESLLFLTPSLAQELLLSQRAICSPNSPVGIALGVLDSVVRSDLRNLEEGNAEKMAASIVESHSVELFQKATRISIAASFLATSTIKEMADRWKKAKGLFAASGREMALAFKSLKIHFDDQPNAKISVDSASYFRKQTTLMNQKYANPSSQLLLEALLTESVKTNEVLSALADPQCKMNIYAHFVVSCLLQTLTTSLESVEMGFYSPENACSEFFENLVLQITTENEKKEVIDYDLYEFILAIEKSIRSEFLNKLIIQINKKGSLIDKASSSALFESTSFMNHVTFWSGAPQHIRLLLPRPLDAEIDALLEQVERIGEQNVPVLLDSQQPDVQEMRQAHLLQTWEKDREFTITTYQIPSSRLNDVIASLKIIVCSSDFQSGLLVLLREAS
jgi:hypothetical protein